MKFNRLWIIYAMLFAVSAYALLYFGASVVESFRSKSGHPLAWQWSYLFYIGASWGLGELLYRQRRQEQLIHKLTLKATTDDFQLEDALPDLPVPEAVETMAKRVQATIAKKTPQQTSLESVKRVGDTYICRLMIGEHRYTFKVPVDKGEDANTWIEQGRNVMQLISA